MRISNEPDQALAEELTLAFGEGTEIVYCLRTCDARLRSYGGFQWPEHGLVEAPDWRPDDECGHGLHGFLWGAGDGVFASWAGDARWLVFAAAQATVIDLNGKVKVPRALVIFCGERLAATAFLSQRAPKSTPIIGGTATAGDGGTVAIRWWDEERQRWRVAVGEIDGERLRAGRAYVERGGQIVPKEDL